MPDGVIFDIDGTLVDTNYQHALAWYQAFRQENIRVPVWKIHRHLGMGGDQFVAAVVGEEAEEKHGDDVRAAHDALYMASIETVSLFDDARAILEELKQSEGRRVVLASSAKEAEVDHYLDLLEARDLVDGWTTSADVEATKPEPDLVHAALEKLGSEDAVMIGDTPWDIKAAAKADVQTIGVLTGGFARAELEEAGALSVYESVAELRAKLADAPIG